MSTATDRSGTIASTGVAQDLAAANANRVSLAIINLDGTNTLWVRLDGTAPAADTPGSIPLAPNFGNIVLETSAPSQAIKVLGTAGQKFTAWEI